MLRRMRGGGRGTISVLIAVLFAPGAAWGADAATGEAALARKILAATGVTGGLIVHVGCGDGKLTAALRANDSYLVHGLDADAADVDTARKHIRSLGAYGSVSIARQIGGRLPYIDNLVNLVVSEDLGPGAPGMDEVMRVLSPNGVAYVKKDGAWTMTVKPRPGNIDEWTHYLHDSTGNPVAHDTAIGPVRSFQWIGGPRWARHHDHMASMTSLVSSGERLFYIFDEGPTASIQLPSQWRLIARDAFNGTILWKRQIAQWNTRQWPLKSGPAHLTRRLVAVGDRVFVTLSLEAPVTALDAATGKTVLTYRGSDRTREILVADDVLLAVVGLAPSPLPKWRRTATYVWDNTRRANRDWAWGRTPRWIMAYEAGTGRSLWKVKAPVAPCSLAADSKNVIFYDGQKVVCLRRADGSTRWKSEPVKAAMPVQTSTGPRTLIYRDVVLFSGNTGRMTALSLATGKTLWSAKQHPSGHQSLKDLLVVGGLVWSGAVANGKDSGVFTGRDPRTGKVRNEFRPDVKIYWFHHRCYPSKATDRYLLTSRTGIEFIDPKTRHWETHHWVRGGCIYGIMPCNGMIYAPMHSCGCYLESKLDSFNALAPAKARSGLRKAGDAGRLERGPAYGHIAAAAAAGDWPTYRHDPARSGSTPSAVPAGLKQAWRAEIGGRLSAPVIAGGRLFVAAKDMHAVHALDAETGRALWTFTAGGRVDSPPTIYRGLVLFGSADGWIYALRADDGALAWRFCAAPMDQRMVAYGQVESVWPAHGSVLVRAEPGGSAVLYCTAGRSIFLDGGIRFLRLAPATGRKLGEVVWGDRDPASGRNMQIHVKGLNMPVALSDVLSFDGRHLYMRSQRIDLKGRRLEIPVSKVQDQHAEAPHLFCQIGFLDDSWFHRSYWTYGRRVDGGYGGWFRAARYVPSGRIMVFDDRRVYGYGRKPEYFVNASVLEYHLFAADKRVAASAAKRVDLAKNRINRRTGKKNSNSSDWKVRRGFPSEDLTAARYQWAMDQPSVQIRAMVAAGETLVVAGHPDVVDERRAFRLPDETATRRQLERQAEALAGRHGGRLWMISKKDGRPIARYHLDAPPVFDGMAAAGGRLFMATLDGAVVCLGADGAAALRPVGASEPLHVISNEPKGPGYPKQPEVDKSKDFSKCTRCRVVQSKLGYRIVGQRGKTALAVKKLSRPLTGKVTLKATLRVPEVQGFLQNGYIAFGDGPAEYRLVKCGFRYKIQKAEIAQGSLKDKGKLKIADAKAELGKELPLVVEVDLRRQQVTFTAGGATIEAKLLRPLRSITHVGYCVDSAIAEFSPLKSQSNETEYFTTEGTEDTDV